jgi:molybdopterin-containing oxidoreductase family iron-sulfur binding subunit
MVFGDVRDPASEVRRVIRERRTVRRRPELGTRPQLYYEI